MRKDLSVEGGLSQNQPPQHLFNLNNVKIQELPKWYLFTTFGTCFSRSTLTGVHILNLHQVSSTPGFGLLQVDHGAASTPIE